jgi:hypothetical protein
MTEKKSKATDRHDHKTAASEHEKSIKKSAAKSKDEKGDTSKKGGKGGVESDDWNDPTGNSHLSSKK